MKLTQEIADKITDEFYDEIKTVTNLSEKYGVDLAIISDILHFRI